MTNEEAAVVRCGIHSGIPVCCVLWFVQTWAPARYQSPWPSWTDRYWDAQRRLEQEVLGRGVEYVMCPDCLEAGVAAAAAVPYECSCLYPRPQDLIGLWAPLAPRCFADLAYSGR